MRTLNLLILFGFILLLTPCADAQIRSKKKGLVIPFWPRHMCGDFETFQTISWWYNYHTYREVWDQVPYQCTCENGSPPKNHSVCLPEDPHEVQFVPQKYGVKGTNLDHGRTKTNLVDVLFLGHGRGVGDDDPPIADW